MGGGLMQLVAYGAQDIYLTGNPQITFFKTIYKRHTNFSMEHIQQTFQGAPVSGARVVATISRNGDLIYDCYIRFKFNNAGGKLHSINNPGHALINNVELEIGGQLIDRQYGHFMEAHSELTEKNYGDNINKNDNTYQDDLYIGVTNSFYSSFQQTAGAGGISIRGSANIDVVSVPLRFWFCRNIGAAIPLISLQYHEVNLNITFSGPVFIDIDGGAIDGTVVMKDEPELWVNYIYLDTDERRRFAQVSHEYLIEQVQTQEFELENASGITDLKLNFNHPVKELIWGSLTKGIEWGDRHNELPNSANLFVPFAQGITSTMKLILNGHDRFAEQDIDYFTRYQPYKYHKNLSRSNNIDTIGVYSFALRPEEHQPSGTCNFSRIDSAIFEFKNTLQSSLKMYAINYNVLRIMSGMGGLAYSN